MAVYRNRSREIAERLIKLRDYLQVNATQAHPAKAQDILEYLGREGHDIKIKTLYSDIHTLQDFFRLKLKYDEQQKGYVITEPDFESHELRMIVNSIQAAKFITQQEADKLTSKIMRLADEHTRPSLKRQTHVPNRVRAINEQAMKGLDIIYEAIAQNQKIRYKYFKYALDSHTIFKEYCTESNSRIITASPYKVVWQDDKFLIYAVQKIPKEIYFEHLEHDEDECADDFVFDDMDDTGLFVYDLSILELRFMEQIELLPEKREGKDIAQRLLNGFNKKKQNIPAKTKLKVNNMYVSDVIDKFGNDISMFSEGHTFFIATINEEPTPELYMWTREFVPPIEIIYPEDAEDELRSYLLRLSKDNDPNVQIIRELYRAEEEFLSVLDERD